MARTGVCFIDTFSVGLDEIPLKEITTERILSILSKTGRFSIFEVTANPTIARAMTGLMKSHLVEKYTPESYFGKLEPAGMRGHDRDTYPWTYVRLTEAGRKALAEDS
jgi:hypothetical protein